MATAKYDFSKDALSTVANKSNMTPQQMSDYAAIPDQTRLMAKAMNNPGAMQLGGITGRTPSGQGIASVYTQDQALTTTADAKREAAIKDVAAMNGISTDEAAKRYDAAMNPPKSQPQGTVWNPATQQLTDPLTGNKYVGSTGPDYSGLRFQDPRLSSSSPTDTSSPGTLSSADARTAADNLRSTINQTSSSMGQMYADMMTRNEARAKEDQARLEQQRQAAEAQLKQDQAKETATEMASQIKLGRADTAQGVQEMNALNQQHSAAIQASNAKYADLMLQSKRALEDGDVALAEKQHAAAMDEANFALKLDEANRARQKENMELSTKNIDEIAKSGVMPSDEWLNIQDKANNRSPGTTKGLIVAAQNEQNIKQQADLLKNTKDTLEISKLQNDLKNASTDQMMNIENLRKSHPFGEPFKIGDNTYYGTDTSTVEISKEDGIARQMYIDENGKPQVREIGKLGTANPAEIENVYVNGVMVQRNKKTGQMISTNAPNKNGELSVDTLFPTGSKGGQCGAAMHQVFTDYPYGLNTVDQKRAAINVPSGTLPRAGMQFFQDIGPNGHTGVVTWSGVDEKTGRPIIKVCESNYGNDEKWGTRTLYADDHSIMGYRQGQLNPQVASALGIGNQDSSAQTQDFSVKSQSPFFGGTQTESQYQASVQKEQDAIQKAQQILSGDFIPKAGEKDAVVSRAIAIAKENGYVPEGESIKGLDQTFEDFVKRKQDEAGMTIADTESLRPEFDAKQQTLKAFDAAIKNQAGGITPQRFKVFQSNVLDAIKSGDLNAAKDRLMTGAFRSEQANERKQFEGVNNINRQLDNFGTKLNQYIAAGGNTGLFQGSIEDMAQKIGEIKDPKLRALASSMRVALNDYRQSVTGAAFTESEAKMYDEMFPGISKSPELNKALIEGLKSGFEAKKDGLIRTTLGGEAADAFTESIPVMAMNPATGKMEKALVSPLEFSTGKYKAAK